MICHAAKNIIIHNRIITNIVSVVIATLVGDHAQNFDCDVCKLRLT